MKWLFTIILVAILAVPVISGINYLRKNDLKIFRHVVKEDLKEEELLGSDEVNNFRVAQIQHALKNFGYNPGVIDGRLGKNTRKAIKEFQTAKGISATGKINSRTYFELLENPRIETKETKTTVLAEKQKADLEFKNVTQENTTFKENKTIENPPETTVQLQPKAARQKDKLVKKNKVDRGVDLKYLQSVLKRLGFYKGKIDGIAGKNTHLAIKRYQRTRSLKADGILGNKTKLCLMREG
jgi:peptidoglycan hydrolase-like protein with peptidoglycan-binding domain